MARYNALGLGRSKEEHAESNDNDDVDEKHGQGIMNHAEKVQNQCFQGFHLELVTVAMRKEGLPQYNLNEDPNFAAHSQVNS